MIELVSVLRISSFELEEMQRSMAVYSAPDLRTLGKGIDEVGMTEEFQKMLEQASKLGTLDRAFGMETIR